jgi:integrase
MARRRYQKGNIRKRGKRKPVWELQWWEDYINPDGTIGRKRESAILGYVSETTLRQARKAAEEKLRPINEGRAIPYSTLTFREFVAQFFVPLVFPTLKVSTRKRYRSTLDVHLLTAFGDRHLRDIGTADLQRFIIQKFERGLAWDTCKNLRNLCSKLFASAKKWGQCTGENPVSGLELPARGRPVREKHVLMPEQVPQFLVRLREPVRTMALLAVLTGPGWRDPGFVLGRHRPRQGRAARATCSYRGSIGSPKTNSSRRTLPLPQALIAGLRSHGKTVLNRGSGYLVFPSRKGTPFNDSNLLLRHLKPAGRQIGAPWLSWHTLRRTHATLLQVAGGSAKDAQAQLGHTNIATTLGIYTFPIPRQQREAVDKLSKLVTNGDEFGQKLDPVEGEAVSLH